MNKLAIASLLLLLTGAIYMTVISPQMHQNKLQQQQNKINSFYTLTSSCWLNQQENRTVFFNASNNSTSGIITKWDSDNEQWYPTNLTFSFIDNGEYKNNSNGSFFQKPLQNDDVFLQIFALDTWYGMQSSYVSLDYFSYWNFSTFDIHQNYQKTLTQIQCPSNNKNYTKDEAYEIAVANCWKLKNDTIFFSQTTSPYNQTLPLQTGMVLKKRGTSFNNSGMLFSKANNGNERTSDQSGYSQDNNDIFLTFFDLRTEREYYATIIDFKPKNFTVIEFGNNTQSFQFDSLIKTNC